ncbi:hypothetical protein [Gelidibacter sp.]
MFFEIEIELEVEIEIETELEVETEIQNFNPFLPQIPFIDAERLD